MSSTTLEQKLLSRFGDQKAVVHKGVGQFSSEFRKLPRFVSDYLVASLVDPDNPSEGLGKIERLLREKFVESSDKELIKSRIREKGKGALFGHVRVRYDQGRDTYWAQIPALGDSNVRIDKDLIARYGETLLTTGAWGSCDIAYDPTVARRGKTYPFFVTHFQPMQITEIDLDGWVAARSDFTTEEWIDLLITSIGFDPARLDQRAKLLYLIRMIPFVESNCNLIELGPTESGKTYTYRAMSSYSFVVSGSTTTVASLFYNKLRRQIGLIGHRDCVMFDEITSANMKDMSDVIQMLKDYMNNGRFGRDAEEFGSDCGIVFVGNIDTDRNLKEPRGFYRHLFSVLPSPINEDRAFLDRIHGFIPGWEAPQISPANYAKSYGWMADYLSEVMHLLRDKNYTHIVQGRTDLDKMGQRNQTAVVKLASGLLKLVHPDKTLGTLETQALKWVMDIAIELRQRVIDQLAVIAPGEFSGVSLSYRIKE